MQEFILLNKTNLIFVFSFIWNYNNDAYSQFLITMKILADVTFVLNEKEINTFDYKF